MRHLLTLLLSLTVILGMQGCTTDDNYPSILTEDVEVVISFENLTDKQICFEVGEPWHVSDFTVDPQSRWDYSFIMKAGERDVFTLSMSSFIVYADNTKIAEITGKEANIISPAHGSCFSENHYEATNDAISRSTYSFVITEEILEAWNSADSYAN